MTIGDAEMLEVNSDTVVPSYEDTQTGGGIDVPQLVGG